MQHFAYFVALWIFLVGLYGVVTSRNYVHMVGCVAILQTATYVILLAGGFRSGAVPPIFYGVKVGTPAADPVVQALMLTDVVVEATFVALILAIAIQLHKSSGKIDPQELEALEG